MKIKIKPDVKGFWNIEKQNDKVLSVNKLDPCWFIVSKGKFKNHIISVNDCDRIKTFKLFGGIK